MTSLSNNTRTAPQFAHAELMALADAITQFVENCDGEAPVAATTAREKLDGYVAGIATGLLDEFNAALGAPLASPSPRTVKWGRPAKDRYNHVIRTSKCGRFRIETRKMASARNGYWNAVAYEPQHADGTRAAPLQDTLEDALNSIEWIVNPSWTPA